MLRSGAPIMSVEALTVRFVPAARVDCVLLTVARRLSDGRSTLTSNTVSSLGEPLDRISKCTSTLASPHQVSICSSILYLEFKSDPGF